GKGDLSFIGWTHRNRDLTGLGELEGVGQKILEHLLEALRIGFDAVGKLRVDLDLERQALVAGNGVEELADAVGQSPDCNRLGPDFHMPSLDLGEVQDIVDQIEKIIAR